MTFSGGLARLDLLQGPTDPKWTDNPLTLTVFCSETLPLNIVETIHVEDFYEEALVKDELVVPSNSNTKRLEEFPKLKNKTLDGMN